MILVSVLPTSPQIPVLKPSSPCDDLEVGSGEVMRVGPQQGISVHGWEVSPWALSAHQEESSPWNPISQHRDLRLPASRVVRSNVWCLSRQPVCLSQASELPRKAFCSLNHSAHIPRPTFFLIAINFLNRCLPFDKWMLHSSEEESNTFPHLDRHAHLPVHLRRSQVGPRYDLPLPGAFWPELLGPQSPEACAFALHRRLTSGSFFAHVVLLGLCQHQAICWARGDFHAQGGLLGRGLEQMVVITDANVWPSLIELEGLRPLMVVLSFGPT